MIIIIIVVTTVLSWLLCGFVLETFPHFSKLCAWWKKHARGFPETGTTGRWSIHMSSKESRWGMDDKVMGDDIQSFGGPVFQDFLFVYIYLYWLWKGVTLTPECLGQKDWKDLWHESLGSPWWSERVERKFQSLRKSDYRTVGCLAYGVSLRIQKRLECSNG